MTHEEHAPWVAAAQSATYPTATGLPLRPRVLSVLGLCVSVRVRPHPVVRLCLSARWECLSVWAASPSWRA
jgi:hypothetical protein